MKTAVEQFNAVKEFMEVYGQKVNEIYTPPSTKVANFRLSLINEELYGKKELFDSFDNDNVEGILDGVCDVLYVCYGALATFGLNVKSELPELPFYRTNSTSNILSSGSVYYLKNKIELALSDLTKGLNSDQQKNTNDGLADILAYMYSIAKSSNFDLASAFEEVHKSNMSKSCSTKQEALDSIEQRIREGKTEDYTGATVSTVNYNNKVYYIINRASDGKVLKGSNFFEPDLKKYIL